MIFVTVGEQLPFDRLVNAIDVWAQRSGHEVFAQIGNTHLIPNSIKFKKFLNPIEFKQKFLAADVIIAHAGMGTIITAIELEKPLLVMPRLEKYGEHRNDHQLATAKHFLKKGYISVAHDILELNVKLNNLQEVQIKKEFYNNTNAPDRLIKFIRDYVSNL